MRSAGLRFIAARWTTRLIRRADDANAAQDWFRAERLYARALRLRPELAAIHVQHGHALKEQGWLHRAVAAYRRATAVAGEAVDPWEQLGHALALLDRFAAAAAAFAMAIERDPARGDLVAERDAMLARAAAAPPPDAIAAVLDSHELGPAVRHRLDAAFYRAQAPGLAGAGEAALLDHFGRVGLGRLLPLNVADLFEPDFYRHRYRAGRPMPPALAYRHWLNRGLRLGWAPNRASWVEALAAPIRPRLPAAARAFADAVMAVERKEPPAAPPFAWLGAGTPVLPSADAADRAAVLRLLATALDRAGQPASAAQLAALATAAGAAPVMPRDSAAEAEDRAVAQEAAGDWSGALATLGAALRAWPEAADVRPRFWALADRAIHAAWRAAEEQAATEEEGAMAAARQALAARIEDVVAAVPEPPPLTQRSIARLAIVGNADLPQCRLYRIEQKREQLAAAGIEAAFYDERTDIPGFLADMIGYEAVIFYRVPAHAPVINAILSARALGLHTLYEIDDLLFDEDHHPAPFETYGGGLSRAEHRGLALAVPLYAAAMRLCDIALASTDALAHAMEPRVRRQTAFVHRNALGRAHRAATGALGRAHRAAIGAGAADRPAASRLTVIYGSLTKAHKADVATLVEPALLALAATLGDRLSIVFVGPIAPSPALMASGAAVTVLPPLALEAYWSLLAVADIALAMLLPSPATDAKSEIKWLEAAMFGVPALVSRTATAAAVIEDGVTGMLCDTEADWRRALLRLAGDPELRHRIGAAARAAALARYGEAAAAANLQRILDALGPRPHGPPRPRIAIVNVFYPPQSFGGATRVVHDNVRDLTAGPDPPFDIAVFATEAMGGPAGRVRSYPQDGVPVTVVSCPGGGDEMAATSPAMSMAFGRFLDAVRPALVHVHCLQRLTVSILEAARARDIPYLVTLHDGWWISPHQFLLDAEGQAVSDDHADPAATLRRDGPAGFERQLVVAAALRGALAVLAVSEPFAALHRACGVAGVRAVPNGVSALAPRPRAVRTDGPVRLGFVGGRALHKGWAVIEAALGRGAAGVSLLVTDHDLAPGEVRHESWAGLAVTFAGPCPMEAVASLYAGIDVLLAPSLWPESFGLVTREALRCGCWVIASDRGAIAADVVPGVNGFVVDVAGPEGLRAAVAAIAADPQRYRSPPPAVPLRPARAQADDLAALYAAILAPAVPAPPPPMG